MQSLLLPSPRPVLRPTPPRLQIPPAYSDARLLGNLSFTLIRSPPSHPLLSFARSSPPLRGLNAPTSLFAAAAPFSSDESEWAKLAQVAKRLENTSRYFKRLGGLGFWGQLVCTIVSAVILAFSSVVTGKITSPAMFYATAGGVAAAFVSVFWSFGYIRLSERLRRTAREPAKFLETCTDEEVQIISCILLASAHTCKVMQDKAPPRAEVVKSLTNGIVVNILGMGAAILGMQATIGLLVAKTLTLSVIPNYQRISSGQSPVVALDVFLVQASATTILSHFLGLFLSLELLRSVTTPHTEVTPSPR